MELMPKTLVVLAGLMLSSGTPMVENEDMIDKDSAGRCDQFT